MTAPTQTTTTTIGWGVVVTAPNMQQEFTASRDLVDAIGDVRTINREHPGAAAVVYREEEYGPWSDDLGGNSFGVRYEWPDGHVEYEPAGSRADADSLTRSRLYGRRPGATARTASRTVRYGEWRPFGSRPGT